MDAEHTSVAPDGGGETSYMGLFLPRAAARTRLGLVVPPLWLLHSANAAAGSHTVGAVQGRRIRRVLVLRFSIHGMLVAVAGVRGVLCGTVLFGIVPFAHRREDLGDDGKCHRRGVERAGRNYVRVSSVVGDGRVSVFFDTGGADHSTREGAQDERSDWGRG